ncbi:hypothetical protein CASFOL_013242 [Castilleja foliolosa]|uniref:F-box domain-containing protein n=1 Tax=Castilleja foliolosa TaxID=1961234 RepID=A0ABD3DL93_9LAMI
MANSVLLEELMLCILTRLPVKTIVRFKSVCKPWFHLFSTPEFKKLHLGQFSSDPKNQSFIVNGYSTHCSESKNQFSNFNIESGEKMPTILEHPFAHDQNIDLDTIGCCNGLVCIRRDQEIILWNPALKLAKIVPLKDCAPFKMASLGFGYDAMVGDFKVVMLVGEDINITSVEIYSVNLDSWITIDVGFQFSWFKPRNHSIVNGNPYWVACSGMNWLEVFVCFDVVEMVFKIVPMPTTYGPGLNEVGPGVDVDEETQTTTARYFELVDWNGALGAITYNFKIRQADEYDECLERAECVQVFDDIEQIWRNGHTFGPIKVDVDMDIHCSKNEKVLGTLSHDTLFVLDLETGCVKELFLGRYFKVYAYTESLAAYINGMEKVVVKYEPNDLDD